MSEASNLFGFPDPVNEKAARAVAAGVVVLSLVTILLGTLVGTSWLWLAAAVCYGFLARVLTGPALSPLGLLATKVVAPRLGPAKPVPGPPKRFAQGMGLVFSAGAVVLLAVGQPVGTIVLLALLVGAATLEAAFGLCIGCRLFAGLMRIGVIPVEACPECANIGLRQPSAG